MLARSHIYYYCLIKFSKWFCCQVCTITMASRAEPINLQSVEDANAWLIAFEAKCAVEKVDDKAAPDNDKALRFISTI